MVQTWNHGIDMDSWLQTLTQGIDMDSWYRYGLIVQTWTQGMDVDSWQRHGITVQTWTYVIDMDSLYRHGLRVLTTPMVLTQTHVIESVLFNHTCTRLLPMCGIFVYRFGKAEANSKQPWYLLSYFLFNYLKMLFSKKSLKQSKS